MRAPIRARMTGWYVLLLACILCAVGAFVLVRLHADLVDATDRSLRPALHQIAIGYRAEGPQEFRDQSSTVLAGERAASQVLGGDALALQTYGAPVSRVAMLSRARVREVTAGRRALFTATLDGERFRVAAQAVRRRGATQVVVAGASLE